MTMTLRPYQKEALDAVKEKYEAGVRRLIVQLPTGMGKTPTFAALRDYLGLKRKVLVLVHRKELAAQAKDKLETWNPGSHVSIEMGSNYADPKSDFVVASVATVGQEDSQRILKFDPSEYDAIVVDEAHHSIGETYKNTFEHFGLMVDGIPERLLLGVTATVKRGDDQALGQVFDEVAYEYSIRDAITNGWLAPVRGKRIKTSTSLDDVHVRNGEFVPSELAAAVDTPTRNHLIVEGWVKYALGRQTVIFTVDVQHAKNIAAVYNMNGIPAAWVSGDDPERDAKIKAHKEGKIQVIANAQLLTEGYDDWRIQCVTMAKPTRSQLMFTQCIGRGTRIEEGIDNLVIAKKLGKVLRKNDCIVLDVADTTKRHSLVNLCTLFGLPEQLDLDGMDVIDALEKIESAQAANPYVDYSALTDLADLAAYAEDVDLLHFKFSDQGLREASPLQWYRAYDGSYMLTLPKSGEYVKVYKDIIDNWTVHGVVNDNEFQDHSYTDEWSAIQFADSMVRVFGYWMMKHLRRDARVNKAEVSDVQKNMLKALMPTDKFAALPFSKMKKGEAQTLINKLMHNNMLKGAKRA
jgi:superfamily II DNA or RNA helicase